MPDIRGEIRGILRKIIVCNAPISTSCNEHDSQIDQATDQLLALMEAKPSVSTPTAEGIEEAIKKELDTWEDWKDCDLKRLALAISTWILSKIPAKEAEQNNISQELRRYRQGKNDFRADLLRNMGITEEDK